MVKGPGQGQKLEPAGEVWRALYLINSLTYWSYAVGVQYEFRLKIYRQSAHAVKVNFKINFVHKFHAKYIFNSRQIINNFFMSLANKFHTHILC